MSEKSAIANHRSKTVFSLPLEEKTVLWLPDFNKYIVAIPPVDRIIELIYKGKSDKLILEFCVNQLGLSLIEAKKTIYQVKQNLKDIRNKKPVKKKTFKPNNSIIPTTFFFKHFYQINNIIFFIEYESKQIEYLIHPKIAHLEISETEDFTNHFKLFKIEPEIILVVNEKIIGRWNKEMVHFMTGKVSMEILQKIYKNEESDWMAVFHASAITSGKESILFLGDSGDGKSTVAAILMSNGYYLLADDFAPVDAASGKVCYFPAALSVKKKAVDLLLPDYPQLGSAKEFFYHGLGKTARYLPASPLPENHAFCYPCKALVFVKYNKETELLFESIPKDTAFQQLIPDSWISPLPENALAFMNWFREMPCFKLTYSDNKMMVNAINRLFQDDL